MSDNHRTVDSSDGISSRSIARLLLFIGFIPLTLIAAIVTPAEFVVTALILSLLLVIAYMLWSLTRSVKALNRRLERIENEVNN